MVFGEIIEPSTRALIDEDLEEYPEYTESVPNWEGSVEPPNNVDTLIFIETNKVIDLFQNSVLNNRIPVSKINNAGIEIFNMDTNKYAIVFSVKKEFTYGEITELLDKWIRAAKQIFAITSESIYNYQNQSIHEKPASVIKLLSNSNPQMFGYDKLESPNLITGLGASVLTYCIHVGLKCNLFVVYIDTPPSDSLNMGPLLNLLKKLGLALGNTNVKLTTSSNNLYM